MMKFYFNGAPNPAKIALMLEECGLEYEAIPIDTRKGDQHKPEFLAINPNAKVPALVDGDAVIFDSTAILMYLARKTGKFLNEGSDKDTAETLSLLMFVASGIGPYSGQAVHFKHFAPEPKDYALNRYMFEAQRHWDIVNAHLGKQRYMAGSSYSIVDMSLWGWARVINFIFGEGGIEKFPNVKRLLDEINARPAAAKAEALKNNFAFKAEMDEEARKIMFRHLETKVA